MSEMEDLRSACKDKNNEEFNSLPKSMHALSDDVTVSYHIGFIFSIDWGVSSKEKVQVINYFDEVDPAKGGKSGWIPNLQKSQNSDGHDIFQQSVSHSSYGSKISQIQKKGLNQ